MCKLFTTIFIHQFHVPQFSVILGDGKTSVNKIHEVYEDGSPTCTMELHGPQNYSSMNNIHAE